MPPITVCKLDAAGRETWRYTGETLELTPEAVLLEAFFNREDMPFHDIVLKKGDRFVERFYTNRWYNIFAIYDRDDGALKAYYCNIGAPAVIADGTVSYRDLALDLLVYPDGRQLVLDEDEFAALALPESEHRQALAALAELQTRFAAGERG